MTTLATPSDATTSAPRPMTDKPFMMRSMIELEVCL